jgi:hypothetical protein
MGQILPIAHPEIAFDADATAVLAQAYEKATGQLHGNGYTDLVREIIARRIIASALKGERNPDRLCTSALASIGFPE